MLFVFLFVCERVGVGAAILTQGEVKWQSPLNLLL